MTTLKIPASKLQVAPRLRLSRGLAAQSLSAVEQRLAVAERELRIQFTRMAQMQAEIDLLLATLRRATDADAMSLKGVSLQSYAALFKPAVQSTTCGLP